MADTMNYVNPLGGHEVIADVLGQIRRRLATDCNLRQTDGYSGGYSGEVKIKLRLHAVKTSEVEMLIPISQSPEVQAPAVTSFLPKEIEAVEVEEVVTIPLEDNLGTVRDRITDNSEKSIESEAEPQTEEEVPSEPRAKRKYTRRAALAGAMSE